jgi:hypothetical protein
MLLSYDLALVKFWKNEHVQWIFILNFQIEKVQVCLNEAIWLIKFKLWSLYKDVKHAEYIVLHRNYFPPGW